MLEDGANGSGLARRLFCAAAGLLVCMPAVAQHKLFTRVAPETVVLTADVQKQVAAILARNRSKWHGIFRFDKTLFPNVETFLMDMPDGKTVQMQRLLSKQNIGYRSFAASAQGLGDLSLVTTETGVFGTLNLMLPAMAVGSPKPALPSTTFGIEALGESGLYLISSIEPMPGMKAHADGPREPPSPELLRVLEQREREYQEQRRKQGAGR